MAESSGMGLQSTSLQCDGANLSAVCGDLFRALRSWNCFVWVFGALDVRGRKAEIFLSLNSAKIVATAKNCVYDKRKSELFYIFMP